MDAVYNRHVLGPKTTLNLFFSFAKRKYPRNGWYVAKTCSVLNVESLFIVATKCPPNRYLLLCQSCFLVPFCLTSCPQNGCILCEGCCLNFDFLWDTMPSKWMFFVACSMWHPCLVESKCIPQGCLSRQMVSMYHFFLQGNAPKIDAFCDSGSQCVIAQCPRHGRFLWHRLSM